MDVCAELGLEDATLIGHSVGAMMAVSAAVRDDGRRFGRLILLTASPATCDHPEDGYVGGFTRQDLDDVFESLDANYVVWAESMAPVYMNTPHAPELEHEIQGSFGRISPRVARDFARVAFLSDVRHLLADVTLPVLVLQSTDDVVTPDHVGTYLHEELPAGTLVRLAATGHFPQSSAPEETATAILEFLEAVVSQAATEALDYGQLFHQAPAGYIVAGTDGTILAANATICAWTGADAGALDGARVLDLMPAGDRLMFRTHAGPKLERDGHLAELSLELLGPDGQRQPVLLSITRTLDGPEPRDLMIFFAAPERRRYERELAGAYREARGRRGGAHGAAAGSAPPGTA